MSVFAVFCSNSFTGQRVQVPIYNAAICVMRGGDYAPWDVYFRQAVGVQSIDLAIFRQMTVATCLTCRLITVDRAEQIGDGFQSYFRIKFAGLSSGVCWLMGAFAINLLLVI